MLRQVIKIGFIVLFLNGCGMLSPVVTPEIKSFQISGAETESNLVSCSHPSIPEVLQITRMKDIAPYDTTKMLYSSSQYRLETYSYNQWITSPDRMLGSIMFQKIFRACIYKNVVNADLMTMAKYRLDTQLLELKQILSNDNTKVSLKILALVIDNQNNNVIKSKTFTIIANSTPDPLGYVSGANQAASEFLNQLVIWLKG